MRRQPIGNVSKLQRQLRRNRQYGQEIFMQQYGDRVYGSRFSLSRTVAYHCKATRALCLVEPSLVAPQCHADATHWPAHRRRPLTGLVSAECQTEAPWHLSHSHGLDGPQRKPNPIVKTCSPGVRIAGARPVVGVLIRRPFEGSNTPLRPVFVLALQVLPAGRLTRVDTRRTRERRSASRDPGPPAARGEALRSRDRPSR